MVSAHKTPTSEVDLRDPGSSHLDWLHRSFMMRNRVTSNKPLLIFLFTVCVRVITTTLSVKFPWRQKHRWIALWSTNKLLRKGAGQLVLLRASGKRCQDIINRIWCLEICTQWSIPLILYFNYIHIVLEFILSKKSFKPQIYFFKLLNI